MAKKLTSCFMGELAEMHGFHSSKKVAQYKQWVIDLRVDGILEELGIDIKKYDNHKLPLGLVWVLRRYIVAPEDINNPEIMDRTIHDFFPLYQKDSIQIKKNQENSPKVSTQDDLSSFD
jgi:hypothetical protein